MQSAHKFELISINTTNYHQYTWGILNCLFFFRFIVTIQFITISIDVGLTCSVFRLMVHRKQVHFRRNISGSVST